jgi:hypothetical protein
MNSELSKAYFVNTLEYKEIPEIVKCGNSWAKLGGCYHSDEEKKNPLGL